MKGSVSHYDNQFLTICKSFSHRVGAQGHSSPTASAELGLAVRTQVPTSICKLGLVADATGWCIVPMNS